MRIFRLMVCLFYLLITCIPGLASADEGLAEQLKAMRGEFKSMQERMNALEAKVIEQDKRIAADALEKQAYQHRIAGLEEQLGPQSMLGQASAVKGQGSSKWTPDIGVVVDTVFALNSSRADQEGKDQLSLRELELVLGSNVDPYSRLDATVAFSTSEDEPASLEEAYLTRFGLPLNSTARFGKFKPKVGKAIPLHRDSLDTVDEPLVIQRYFSEEGLSKTGVDISKTLDLPIPITQQVTLGILEGGNAEEDEGIFGGPKRRPILYGHLKNYIDVTDQTGFELGGSYLAGSRDEDQSFEVGALGIDATLTHNFNATQKLKIQGEAFNVNRKQSYADVEEDDGLGGTVTNRYDLDGNIWGAYGLVDLRLHQLWSIGGRYDFVQPIATELPVAGVRKDDRAYSGYFTFHQSEFARWRAQFTHTDFATGKADNAVYIQGTFAIGDHKHKI